MRRRNFLAGSFTLLAAPLAAAVLLLVGSVAAEAQQAVYRVGFVSPLSAAPEPIQHYAFRQVLRELGYVDGKNVIIETRFAEGRNDRLPELVAGVSGTEVLLSDVMSLVQIQPPRPASTRGEPSHRLAPSSFWTCLGRVRTCSRVETTEHKRSDSDSYGS